MASRKVSILKFVGTVSLGLLTGVSYSLSNLTIPALLELPSASSAAKAYRSLASTASTHLSTLAGISGSAFLLAFIVSPRGYRHPYLLYTSLFVFGSQLTQYVTPTVCGVASPAGPNSAAVAQRRQALQTARREKQAARRMEASYEVLGSDTHSDEGTASVEFDELEEELNGEEIRSEVEFFVKDQLVQAALTGLAFMMSVIGIWGDGVTRVMGSETLIFELQ